jgi:hypothetical protein
VNEEVFAGLRFAAARAYQVPQLPQRQSALLTQFLTGVCDLGAYKAHFKTEHLMFELDRGGGWRAERRRGGQ